MSNTVDSYKMLSTHLDFSSAVNILDRVILVASLPSFSLQS